MKIIKKNLRNEIIIKKSKFIGIIKIIENEKEITETLNKLKKEHKLANHICYAYILNNQKKYYDDKEPLKTAGFPILNVLEKNNLNYCLAIVIRYYGGIKLGSTNLLRAYQNTIIDLLKDNLKEISYAKKIRIKTNYQDLKHLKYLLSNSKVTKEEYQDEVIIEAIVDNQELPKLSNYYYEIIKNSIIY